ncbi:MAG: hypothetical protein MUC29_14280 [Pyrinomonadaceae bacterium]|jgi:hypothetical protein|nr:hypothetical protein [Pyrinomonadaceae bacterium]
MSLALENELKTVKVEKDTWILEVPKEVCDREGFADGTLVSLTLSNNSISAKYLKPKKEIDDFVNSIIEEEKEYLEEMKRLGD